VSAWALAGEFKDSIGVKAIRKALKAEKIQANLTVKWDTNTTNITVTKPKSGFELVANSKGGNYKEEYPITTFKRALDHPSIQPLSEYDVFAFTCDTPSAISYFHSITYG
jgi:hypothetical protein